jgi:rod shape-determining protein MreC
VAAHIIGNTTDTGAKVVIVDRGSTSGVRKGMAVITPDGIVGKVESVYPMASFVLLITDPTFAAGVISQKNHVHGTVKGQGHSTVIVDYVQNEEKVEQGEWFYTSGDDLIFPKGLPVGESTVVRPGKARKEIYVTPSGFQNGTEEVLIVVEGVHAPIPDTPPGEQPVHLLDHPPVDTSAAPAPSQNGPSSDADRVEDQYRKIGEAEKHVYGERGTGAPNYNLSPDQIARKAEDAKSDETKASPSKPASSKPAPTKSAPAKPGPKPPNP